MEEFIGTGRRKTAVSSVRLRKGNGNIDVNGKTFDQYFPLEIQRSTILLPFAKSQGQKKYDMIIRVNGGGVEGQVIASRLGIARALLNESGDLHAEFRAQGYLTRDSRKKERKKYGRKKAR